MLDRQNFQNNISLTQISPVEHIWSITKGRIKLLLISTANILKTILLSFWDVCDCIEDVFTVLFSSCN